jgi:hypothetical protein
MLKELEKQVADLTLEYDNAKGLYDGAGLNAELKESALQAMANILQLQQLALNNWAIASQVVNANLPCDACASCD